MPFPLVDASNWAQVGIETDGLTPHPWLREPIRVQSLTEDTVERIIGDVPLPQYSRAFALEAFRINKRRILDACVD